MSVMAETSQSAMWPYVAMAAVGLAFQSRTGAYPAVVPNPDKTEN